MEIDDLYAVGDNAKDWSKGFANGTVFSDQEKLCQRLAELIEVSKNSNLIIAVKGSRSTAMDKVSTYLKNLKP